MSVLALRHPIEVEPGWSLSIPSAGQWLTSNDRGRWTKTHRAIADWRLNASWAAAHAKVRAMERAYILAELRFPDRRRRDPANWYPTVKAAVDGLVDVGVLPGDWSKHVIGPDMRMGPLCRLGIGSLRLHLWEVNDV